MIYLPRDIRQIKLITGEELLAECIGEDSTEYLITNALKIHKEKLIIQGIPKEVNFFTKWMGLAENPELAINRNHVITTSIVNDQVAAYYNSLVHASEDDVTFGTLKTEIDNGMEDDSDEDRIIH
jgi:hypothetical protein